LPSENIKDDPEYNFLLKKKKKNHKKNKHFKHKLDIKSTILQNKIYGL